MSRIGTIIDLLHEIEEELSTIKLEREVDKHAIIDLQTTTSMDGFVIGYAMQTLDEVRAENAELRAKLEDAALAEVDLKHQLRVRDQGLRPDHVPHWPVSDKGADPLKASSPGLEFETIVFDEFVWDKSCDDEGGCLFLKAKDE